MSGDREVNLQPHLAHQRRQDHTRAHPPRRNVGEVRGRSRTSPPRPSRHVMIDTPEGDVLRLWDTPGFGDSARLARRLAQPGNPIGWFLSRCGTACATARSGPASRRCATCASERRRRALPGQRRRGPRRRRLRRAGDRGSSTGSASRRSRCSTRSAPRPRGGAERADEARWRAHLARVRLRARRARARRLRALLGAGDRAARARSARALPAAKRPALERLAAAWHARRMAAVRGVDRRARRPSRARARATASRSTAGG